MSGSSDNTSLASAVLAASRRQLRTIRNRAPAGARQICLVGCRFQDETTGDSGLVQAVDAASAAGLGITMVAWPPVDERSTHAIDVFAGRHGFEVEVVPQDSSEILPGFLEATIRLFRYAREQAFDLVLFQDEGGLGYASAVAKRTGQAFAGSQLGIVACSCAGWARERRREFPPSLVTIGEEHIERVAAELADFVVPHRADVCRWMADKGWKLPPLPADLDGRDENPMSAHDWQALLARVMSPGIEATPARLPTRGIRDTTVVVTHFERPHLLDQNLRALGGQTDPNFAVIVVDDGSKGTDAQAYLDTVEERYGALDLSVLRQENRYLGAARNAGIAAAETDFVILMDDDNVAFPHMVGALRTAIHASQADVVTCGIRHFHDDADPTSAEARGSGPEQFFSAGPLLLGVVHNCFGDASGIYRKEALAAVGGFHELYGVSFEDWQLHLRIAVAGRELYSLPEALIWYRVRPGSMLRTTSHFDNARVMAEVVDGLSCASLAPLSDYLIGTEMEQVRLGREIERLIRASDDSPRGDRAATPTTPPEEALRHARNLERILAERTKSAGEAERYIRSLEAEIADLGARLKEAAEYAKSLEHARAEAETYVRELESRLGIVRPGNGHQDSR